MHDDPRDTRFLVGQGILGFLQAAAQGRALQGIVLALDGLAAQYLDASRPHPAAKRCAQELKEIREAAKAFKDGDDNGLDPRAASYAEFRALCKMFAGVGVISARELPVGGTGDDLKQLRERRAAGS